MALGQRLWVRGVIWALGSPTKSKIGLWVRGPKSLGHRRSRSSWVAGNGLSLSLSLCAWARSHSHSLSLSVFRKMIFESKIKTKIILHPTHGQTKKHFRKMYFSCTTKHPHLRKSISRNHFHSKQTQPKCKWNSIFHHCKACTEFQTSNDFEMKRYVRYICTCDSISNLSKDLIYFAYLRSNFTAHESTNWQAQLFCIENLESLNRTQRY